MKASSLAWITGSLITAGAIAGACTYNTYVIEPGSSSTGSGGGSASSASSSSSAGSGGSTSSSSTSGGGAASSSSSSSSSSGMPKCDAGACDEDCDGELSPMCGGADCADQDPNAHHEPPPVDSQPAAIVGKLKAGTLPFDYNCDGKETGATPVLSCAGLTCDESKVGFAAVVPCGMSATLGHCAAVGCAFTPQSPSQNVVQKCK